ncbi:MAG: ABC transporter ATP-binding protein [Hyphomicrobiales bacterium]|nr:ABC transporter ATP-binding protein [Hyphomicrobiales bacterium]
MSAPLLEARGLAIEHRGAPALRGIDLALDDGGALAIVGESGAGKTSLALAIMGLSPASAVVSGSLRLRGRELVGLPERDWLAIRGAEVGMAFQEPQAALDPLMGLADQAGEAARVHRGLSRRAARALGVALLEDCGVRDAKSRARDLPHRFSGGEKQRALIAMALAAEPTLLVADEPTSALDARLRLRILDLVDEQRHRRGLALLLVTHDLAIAARRVERVAVLLAGLVVEEGPAAATLAAPAHPYVRALAAARPPLGAPRDARPLAPAPATPRASALGCPFAPRCPFAEARCAAAVPPLVDVGEGRRARCLKPFAAAP